MSHAAPAAGAISIDYPKPEQFSSPTSSGQWAWLPIDWCVHLISSIMKGEQAQVSASTMQKLHELNQELKNFAAVKHEATAQQQSATKVHIMGQVMNLFPTGMFSKLFQTFVVPVWRSSVDHVRPSQQPPAQQQYAQQYAQLAQQQAQPQQQQQQYLQQPPALLGAAQGQFGGQFGGAGYAQPGVASPALPSASGASPDQQQQQQQQQQQLRQQQMLQQQQQMLLQQAQQQQQAAGGQQQQQQQLLMQQQQQRLAAQAAAAAAAAAGAGGQQQAQLQAARPGYPTQQAYMGAPSAVLPGQLQQPQMGRASSLSPYPGAPAPTHGAYGGHGAPTTSPSPPPRLATAASYGQPGASNAFPGMLPGQVGMGGPPLPGHPGPPLPFAPPAAAAAPAALPPAAPAVAPAPKPVPAAEAKRKADDDNTRPDGELDSRLDILDGLYDAEAEQRLLGGNIGERAMQFAPRVQEEYVLNEAPINRELAKVAHQHGIKSVNPECFKYLSLMVESHMGGLLAGMARRAGQHTDPARRVPGMAPSGLHVRQRLGHIRRGDAEAAKELDRARDSALLQQGMGRSKKPVDAATQLQVDDAKMRAESSIKMDSVNQVTKGFGIRKRKGMFGGSAGGVSAGTGDKAAKVSKAKPAADAAAAAAVPPASTPGAATTAAAAAAPAAAAKREGGGAAAMDIDGAGGGSAARGQAAGRLSSIVPAQAAVPPASRTSVPGTPAAASLALGLTGPRAPAPGGDGRRVLTVRDLLCALERDPVLCKNPLLFKLYATLRK